MSRGPRVIAVLVGAMVTLSLGGSLRAHAATPTLQITSPLGRTGLPGTIRIVARLDSPDGLVPTEVRFLVDDELLSKDVDGPPYEALWHDENPFERRELKAQASFELVPDVTATVVLEPMQVTEVADETCIAIHTTLNTHTAKLVRGIARDDFTVFEDEEPQTIDLLAQRREPALFAVLVDSSQSMAARAPELRTAARRLLEPLAPEDEVIVAPFSRHILNVTGPSTDRATVLAAISSITPGGGTAILDAIREAAEGLSGGTRRRAIVLITDGYDEHSTSAIDETIATLRKSDVTLYAIGIGGVSGVSLKGERVLTQLAESTGGRAWFPRDQRRLALAYEAVASEVQHRYLITYTPKNQRRDGSYRAIRVVAGEGNAVRTRAGYTAPVAPPVRTSQEFTAFAAGRTALSLTRDDVEVIEDGVPQKVDTFHELVLPVTIMLALDASGSMKRSAAQAQEAARAFVLAARPEDEIGMIIFANTAAYIHSPTVRRESSLTALEKYVADGGTALNDALYDSLAQIATTQGRRVVVVVTDGRDENAASTGPGSTRTWGEVLDKLDQTEVVVYPVGIGSNVDRARLQELADRSGGSAFFPADAASLADDYRKILDELRRRYVVGYESSNRARDGRWRTTEIRIKQDGASVRSRGGYYAPPE
jgi:Ca-activated chloride channel family protein